MARTVEPARRENLPTGIADTLRRQIAQGELRPGEQLPGHRELATMFSVSVGSVREAISMLISEGLIATRAGRGTFVTQGSSDNLPAMWTSSPLDRKKVEELIEARVALESQIAVWAAERATPSQISKLESIVDDMESDVTNASAFLDVDVDLHLLLAEAAHNRYLLRTMTNIRTMLRRDLELSTEVAMRRHGNLAHAVAKHRRLVDAIRDRRPDDARAAILEIIDENRTFVIGMYSDSQTS
jgi:GntR family transcriptional repressor for pyruvate dehydrogenase complex